MRWSIGAVVLCLIAPIPLQIFLITGLALASYINLLHYIGMPPGYTKNARTVQLATLINDDSRQRHLPCEFPVRRQDVYWNMLVALQNEV